MEQCFACNVQIDARLVCESCKQKTVQARNESILKKLARLEELRRQNAALKSRLEERLKLADEQSSKSDESTNLLLQPQVSPVAESSSTALVPSPHNKNNSNISNSNSIVSSSSDIATKIIPLLKSQVDLEARTDELNELCEIGERLIEHLRRVTLDNEAETAMLKQLLAAQPSGPTHPKQLNNLRFIRTRVDEELKQVRVRLLREVLCFFPCNPVSETEHKLVNITMPNDCRHYYKMDPVVVSAALGHAARLLNIGAACLAVYLPHKLIVCGSTTQIVDCYNQKTYRLYNSDVPEEEFDHALLLFNDDIKFLAFQQERDAELAEHATLPNLLAALRNRRGYGRHGHKPAQREFAAAAVAELDGFVVLPHH